MAIRKWFYKFKAKRWWILFMIHRPSEGINGEDYLLGISLGIRQSIFYFWLCAFQFGVVEGAEAPGIYMRIALKGKLDEENEV